MEARGKAGEQAMSTVQHAARRIGMTAAEECWSACILNRTR